MNELSSEEQTIPGAGSAGPEEALVDSPEEVSSESRVELNYLAPEILDSITTVNPEQLQAMESQETAGSDRSFEALYESSVGDIREDEVLKGRVIGLNEREVLVDIGFKSEGIVARQEFTADKLPQIGDEITVYLVKIEDSAGQMILSKEKAEFMQHWGDIRATVEDDGTIRGKIVRRIKGGMVVDLDGILAFLPGSQIDIRPVQDFESYIGQEYDFKIVKLNEARKNVVLSRKGLLQADLMEKRKALMADLHVGQILEGRVKNITDFGVFVDLGGIDGLLHITDLSWGRVGHPSEIVELDESLTIQVIDFDVERQRVSLGLKQLQPHPWESVEVKFPVDSTVSGTVVSMTNYGAFVELEKGVEGLVHVSEMSWTRHVRHPSELFSLGDQIESRVLSIDPQERKISLGIKQLQPDPWEEIESKYSVDAMLTGRVRNLTQFGAFVELEPGVDGLIHITDLSWTRNVRHPKEILSKGDEVEVRVLDVSRENRRIALGLKQVTEDPWEGIDSYFVAGKQVEGTVVRVLDKGVILQLELDMEGIVLLRDTPKRDRRQVTEHIRPGDVMKVTVQELSAEEKKVILMSDDLAVTRSETGEEGATGEPLTGAEETDSTKISATSAPPEDEAPADDEAVPAPADDAAVPAPAEEMAASAPTEDDTAPASTHEVAIPMPAEDVAVPAPTEEENAETETAGKKTSRKTSAKKSKGKIAGQGDVAASTASESAPQEPLEAETTPSEVPVEPVATEVASGEPETDTELSEPQQTPSEPESTADDKEALDGSAEDSPAEAAPKS